MDTNVAEIAGTTPPPTDVQLEGSEFIVIPTAEDYGAADSKIPELEAQRDRLFQELVNAHGADIAEAIRVYNDANKAFCDASKKLDGMRRVLLEHTNAVNYNGGLVVLSADTGKGGVRLVRVAAVYGGGGTIEPQIKPGAAFTADLTNAPKPFHDAMFQGPFLVNLDGTLDVNQRYDRVPEGSGPVVPPVAPASQPAPQVR